MEIAESSGPPESWLSGALGFWTFGFQSNLRYLMETILEVRRALMWEEYPRCSSRNDWSGSAQHRVAAATGGIQKRIPRPLGVAVP